MVLTFSAKLLLSVIPRHDMKIKVQLFKQPTTAALVNPKTKAIDKLPVTFIAFSDEMKARVLENFLKASIKIGISVYDGPVETGEWLEKPVEGAIYNR